MTDALCHVGAGEVDDGWWGSWRRPAYPGNAGTALAVRRIYVFVLIENKRQ